MKSKILIYWFLVLCSTFYYSCEEKIDWQSEGKSSIKMVVEGHITNEKAHHQLKLTLPLSSPTDKPSPYTGAEVTLTDQSTSWHYTETPPLSGIYLADSAFRAALGISYTLTIQKNSDIFQAQTTMVPNSLMEIPFLMASPDSIGFFGYKYQRSVEPSMLELSIDWTGLDAYSDVDVEKKRAVLWFYTLNSIDVSEIFKPEQTPVYFPRGTKLVRRKYALSDEQQKFIRSLLLETEWRGGLFDTSPANVETNITGGAAGFFGAYTVVSDSLEVP